MRPHTDPTSALTQQLHGPHHHSAPLASSQCFMAARIHPEVGLAPPPASPIMSILKDDLISLMKLA